MPCSALSSHLALQKFYEISKNAYILLMRIPRLKEMKGLAQGQATG